MHFLRVNVTFYDAVNTIHDVLSTDNPFTDTTKFMLVILFIYGNTIFVFSIYTEKKSENATLLLLVKVTEKLYFNLFFMKYNF